MSEPRARIIRRPAAGPVPLFSGSSGWLQGLGLAGIALAGCAGLYLRILLGRARLDLPAFAAALRQAGLSMLPAITLVSMAVGFILGHQTQSILAQFDLPGLILLSFTYTIVTELVPLLVGILIAGRAGVALAVRQATLAVSGELDGLLVSGIDPIQFTLGPVLLAMLLMSFAFVVWSTLITFCASALWLWAREDLPPALFLDALTQALTPADLLAVVLKPMLFAVLIALVASVNGSAAGRDPDGIAQAATRTMIGAVVAILVADLLYILLA